MKNRLSRLVFALGIAGASFAASANTPRELDDLVGVRASSGSSAMEQRGWVHIDSERGPDRIYSHYWDPRSRTCVNVNVMDGRFRSINSVPSYDCNQQPREDDDDDAKAAAIAVGAAALIGALALAHKSHHRDGEHGDDSQSVAEFDRGYRDGQYHHSYNNYNRTDAYRDGYEAGTDSREHHGTRHQQHASYGNHGYPQRTGFSDLVGGQASSVDMELRKRGFHDVDSFRSGRDIGTIWYKRSTHQCLQMITVNGAVNSLNDIHTHPSCH